MSESELFLLALDAVNNGNGYGDKLRIVCTDYENKKKEEIEQLRVRVAEYEQRLFDCGQFEAAPCFICGYNGPGYFQSLQHKCAGDPRREVNKAAPQQEQEGESRE